MSENFSPLGPPGVGCTIFGPGDCNIFGPGGCTVFGPTALPAPEILSPFEANVFQIPDSVLFAASVDTTLALTSVEFFLDGVSVATVATAPYYVSVPGLFAGAGAHVVTAKAHYASGITTTSDPVNITVQAAPATIGSFAGVRAWWDTSDNANVTSASGAISAVGNKQGAANYGSAVQADPLSQPDIARVRGVQSMFFGTRAQARLVSTAVGTTNQPWVKFAVTRQISVGAAVGIVMIGGSGGRLNQGGPYPSTLQVNANVDLTAASQLPADPPVLFSGGAGTGGAGLGDVRKNSVVVASGTTGTRTLTATESIGASAAGATAVTACIGEPTIAFNISASDRNSLEAAVIQKYHLGEPSASCTQIGDSITAGQGSDATQKFCGYRYVMWAQAAKFSLNKSAKQWVEQMGPLPAATPQYEDDQHYGNSGQGVNFMLANLPSVYGAGAGKYQPKMATYLILTNNARSLPGETYVPGIGPGSNIETYIQTLGQLFAAGITTIVVSTIIDSNPAFGTGPGSVYQNIRDLNALLQSYAWDEAEARFPGLTLIRLDLFAVLGPWDPGTYSDQFHPSPPGYVKLGNGMAWGVIQACYLLS